MKISILLELLLVFIIIAFGAAKPISKNERRTETQTEQKITLRKVDAISRKNETTEDDDYDDDDDDIFGLGSANDDIVRDTNKDQQLKPSTETDEDDDALDDDDDDEKDSEEDVDDGEFLLFGEDLFGFFDEGNKTKKKKVANKLDATTSLPINVLSNSNSKIKNNKIEQNGEAAVVSIGTVQEVVNQLTPAASSTNTDSIKANPHLHLQHTTALLELAQSGALQYEDSTTMNGIQNIYDIDQSQNESEAYIKDEQNKNEETTESLPEYNEVLNTLKVKKETQISPSGTQISTLGTTLPSKKPTPKPDDSFFGLVESLISDDDDQKTEDENDTAESSAEDEEEADNEEEALIEESEEQNSIKDKNKKKKTSGVIGSIGESFNLFG